MTFAPAPTLLQVHGDPDLAVDLKVLSHRASTCQALEPSLCSPKNACCSWWVSSWCALKRPFISIWLSLINLKRSRSFGFTTSELYWQGVLVAMKFSQLATLLTLLLHTYGEISESSASHFQEDCAGKGNLTAGVRIFHLCAARRDVFCLHWRFQTIWSICVCVMSCLGFILLDEQFYGGHMVL